MSFLDPRMEMPPGTEKVQGTMALMIGFHITITYVVLNVSLAQSFENVDNRKFIHVTTFDTNSVRVISLCSFPIYRHSLCLYCPVLSDLIWAQAIWKIINRRHCKLSAKKE